MFPRFFLTTLALLSFTSSSLQAQNCANNTTGLPPLNDLGTGFYEGLQGGLYPEGQNIRPAAHNAAGLAIAGQIQPLDENGNINLSTGKIVLISVGMSNTREEFDSLEAAFAAYSDGNPQLVLVNGAQDGQDIDNLIRNSSIYWSNVIDSLSAAGLTIQQVQVIWFKEAQSHPLIPPLFPDYPDTLKEKFKTAMNLLVRNVPNVRICYLSSRIYGDYGVTPLNLEPYAYQSGWAVKRLIEDQINGDPDLRFDGADPVAPWLSWGPYLWADGETPRQDGLAWHCPDDFEPDGNHPSTAGRQKVAGMLLDFFRTDVTTIPWFVALSTDVRENTGAEIPASMSVKNYPNPFNPSTTIEFRMPEAGPARLTLHNLLGEELRVLADGVFSPGVHRSTFNGTGLGSGVYYYILTSGPHRLTGRMMLLK